MKIDLGNHYFLCFVQTGTNIPFAEPNHNTVFFLVLTPNRDAVRLMYYSTFPWPIHKNNTEIKNVDDALHIVSGTLCTVNDEIFKEF